MATIISHFYNEAYLLPFWLKHHLQYFEHGILINHGSTDESVKICKEIAPHWEIVNSKLPFFDAPLCDVEVMIQEWNVPSWKLVLNTSEFFCPGPRGIEAIQAHIEEHDAQGGFLTCKIMVDGTPDKPVEVDLVQEKSTGVFQEEVSWFDRWKAGKKLASFFKCSRSRFIHRGLAGCYSPGRHGSYLFPTCQIPKSLGYVAWYAYSPWNENFISRKLSFKSKIPQNNIREGIGVHHLISASALHQNYLKLRRLISPKQIR